MSDLSDAITVTGATTGKVVSSASINVPLSTAQKAAIVSFVQNVAQWPGNPQHIQNIVIGRDATGGLYATISGYIVHADAATALAAKNAGTVSNILGSA